jgi:predicted DNA-binding protein (UPF0251 family)
MPRPKKCRNIKCDPAAYYFKPRAIPMTELEEVALNIDEFEAVRLADHMNLYHDDAAAEMKVSRATFGRILKQARAKVADALIHGKALKIEALSESDGK